MRQRRLEMLLEKVPRPMSPVAALEQYSTPAKIAADILYKAYPDIVDKKVFDLGCGTGIFAIGAKLLGAKLVVGIDIDERCIALARKVAAEFELDVTYIVEDINTFDGECDTVIQNPPFGAQDKHKDRSFLERAFAAGKVIYSLHNANTDDFITRYVTGLNGTITYKETYSLDIPHMFDFHKKAKKDINVNLYRIVNKCRKK